MKISSVAILGGGESGVGAALLAKKYNIPVFLSEYGNLREAYREELRENNIPFEEKGHTVEILRTFEFIVKSPGIPEEAKVIKALRKDQKTIISEIEFAYRFNQSKIVAITGSNGKTTTTSLIYHILKKSDRSVRLGGNIGKSFARILSEESDFEIAVIEVSSFQLDDTLEFRPDIAILLNITEDHLDRYSYQIENYALAKMRIAMNQKAGDHFIFNDDDEWINKLFDRTKAKQFLHPIQKSQYETGQLLMKSDMTIDMKRSDLNGIHNYFNAACAVQSVLCLGEEEQHIQKAIESFSNVPHRLEKVRKINDVLFVNDSKATNVDSVFYALQSFRNIIWIAGGVDKGNDYRKLKDLVRESVKSMICLGLDNTKLKDVFHKDVNQIVEFRDMQKAILWAWKNAEKGDVVLLSPACASFDLFNNYEHRGDEFKKEVLKLG